jgi:succinylglutamic semialdehyde dehydrogenase
MNVSPKCFACSRGTGYAMSTSEIVSLDPCTGEVVWRGAAVDRDQLDAVVSSARGAFAAWSETSLQERRAVAGRFAERVRETREALARLISQETGKPYWEALTEADSVAAKVAISIGAQDQRATESVVEASGVRQAVRHRPHGVLAVIGPFNFPMHLANGHIVPALLAGNAVVFKPSEKTPASGLRMAELWREAGLPDGVLQVVVGDGSTGADLVAHPEVDGVLFTGGEPAGLRIHQALAGRPDKILALELGGNNPLVAWDVDDFDAAAHLIVQSAYVSAGQRCSCARRLIVPRGVAGDQTVEALISVIDRLRVGAPFDQPAPFLGPVIDNAAADALLAAQFRLIGLGGVSLRAMERLSPGLPFLTPGLIDVSQIAGAPDEEHFGPLLQVVRAESFDQALAYASATKFGLAAGLIGGDEALFRRFWRGVRAGVVNWNRATTGASSAAPFGGVGASGIHRPSAYYAADYCAYPVAGLEMSAPHFSIETGLAPETAAQ